MLHRSMERRSGTTGTSDYIWMDLDEFLWLLISYYCYCYSISYWISIALRLLHSNFAKQKHQCISFLIWSFCTKICQLSPRKCQLFKISFFTIKHAFLGFRGRRIRIRYLFYWTTDTSTFTKNYISVCLIENVFYVGKSTP